MSASEAAVRAPTPKLVLLVEDEADARTILARRLSAFGWNCLAHPSVEAALRDPQLRFVEAVVADVVLGEGRMSGIDLIPALRKEDVRAPVVLVTAFADQQRLKDALNAGAAYLLEKPFTTDALRGVLDKVTSIDVDLTKLVNKALSRARQPRGSRTAFRDGSKTARGARNPLLIGVALRDEEEQRVLGAIVAVAEARLHAGQRGLDLLHFLRREQPALVTQVAQHLLRV